MIAFDKGILPGKLTQNDISGLIGESVRWFCPSCRRWRTAKIKTDEGVFCFKCGSVPDWKKRWPVLSFRSRLKRVNDLCAEGSPWREEHDRVIDQYGNFIDQVNTGLPQSTKREGWKYFGSCWLEIDRIADYILTALDSPATNLPHAYNTRGLQRRYYDRRRRHNMVSFGDLGLHQLADDNNARLTATDQEVVEGISFRHGYMQPSYDQYFVDDFLELIDDPLERKVALDLSLGETKRSIQRRYGLTERRVRTIVKHLVKYTKKYLNNL